MSGDCTLVTGPTVEPVDLTMLKDHLRVTHDEDDELLELVLVRAREALERLTGLAVLSQTWEQASDGFPCASVDNPRGAIVVRKPPLISVTSITYIDTDGNPQVLDGSAYTVNTRRFPGEIVAAYETQWPATRDVPNAVIVRFVAGYGTIGEQVPGALKSALLLMAGDLYAHREETVSATMAHMGAVRALLANERAYVV